MNHITYLGLEISTIFTKGQDYLNLSGGVHILDERTGIDEIGGKINATVLSEQWGEQNIRSAAAGMDVRLERCIRCLEEYDSDLGKVAVILESEFAGEFRAFAEQAFIDLTHFLEQVMDVDHIITFLPFDQTVQLRLGYQKMWGPDKRPYSIRTTRMLSSDDGKGYTESPACATRVIYNRLRTKPAREVWDKLSEDAKKVVSVLEQAGGRALTKANILGSVPFSEEDLSMAMLELIELDLLEEITEHAAESVVIPEIKKPSQLSILGDVEKRDIGRVRELLEAGANINEIRVDGKNALFIAIENNDTDMVDLLLQHGIDPNYESADGTTALKLCWRTQNRAIEKLLGKYGAKISLG